MNNYAIILGVDKYKHFQELGSCENDASMMEGFLNATEKYQVLRLSNDILKHDAIEKIEEFISGGSGEVGEILFYFSGHGKQDQEMYYALSDTTLDKINTTSIKSSEIDELVRKVSPKFFVKIIDACQSGLQYIKGAEEIADGEILPSISKDMNNCIFMFSSKKTQSSYAGNPYSRFTKAIIDAIESVTTTKVKFTDIKNYLSDAFKHEPNQTPYFCNQCECNEIFCEKTEKVIAFLSSLKSSTDEEEDEITIRLSKVRAYLSRCRTDGQVQEIMAQIQDEAKKHCGFNKSINEFYASSVETSIPHLRHGYREDRAISKMLYGKKDSENLFVKVDCSSTKRDNPWGIWASYSETPESFVSLAHQLPEAFAICLKGNNDYLPEYVIPFVFVYSPTYFYVFSCVKQYVKKAWNDYEEARGTRYVYTRFEYQDFSLSSWNEFMTKRLTEYTEYIEKTLDEYIS